MWHDRVLRTRFGLMACLAAAALPAHGGPLPHYGPPGDPDAGWRTALVDFVDDAGLGTSDPAPFDIRVAGVPPAFLRVPAAGPYTKAERHDIERAWLLGKGTGPVTSMVHVPPEAFTLDHIEGLATFADGLTTGADPAKHVFAPVETTGASGYGFLWGWAYGGNPYHGMPEMLNRASVRLAVDLIMVDQAHKTWNNKVAANYLDASDHLNPGTLTAVPMSCFLVESSSGALHPPRYGTGATTACPTGQLPRNRPSEYALSLFNLASEYAFLRPGLAAADQATFDAALVRLGNRLRLWGAGYLQMNRTTPGAPALYLISALTGDLQAAADYDAYVTQMLAPHNYDPAGFFADDHGWDGRDS
jgi:hypothetical protein